MNEQRVIYIPVEQIKPAPWNPSRRTKPSNIAALVHSMKAHGFFWWKPVIIGREDVMGDGHRRLCAAKAANIPHVPALRVDMAADVIWAVENGRRRTVTSAESLEAATLGLTYLPDQHSKSVQEIIAVVGMEQLKQDYMIGVSPHILSWAKRTATYIGHDNDKAMIANIVLWLRKHEMQRRVRGAMDAEVDPSVILGYIMIDKPLPSLKLEFAA